MLEPGPCTSPARGTVPIAAVLFDTFGTVCDFYKPLRAALEGLARDKGVDCDCGRLAIDWRTAYLMQTVMQAAQETPFRPLRQIHRANLEELLVRAFPAPVSAQEMDHLARTWERLDPWPDVVEGLSRIRQRAIIAPLSNGNFADMVRLSRHAGLPWDIILGSSVAGFYKPHPRTYQASVEALGLEPGEVLMVAAHQMDLAFAAHHGMQTAFVARPDEFGGAVKPARPEPGESYLDAAEVHPEEDWTFIASDFVDLARQLETLEN